MSPEISTDTLKIDAEKVEKKIVSFIQKVVKNASADGVVVGLSGGVDSSTTAVLCAKALGKEKVLGLILPEKNVTDPNDIEDAMKVSKMLGIKHEIVNINPIINSFKKACPAFDPENKIAYGNLKPRVRMLALYYYGNKLNRLVAGTGNKSELLCGYFTKYGDGGVDFLPIGGLYKTQVKQLARYLGVPKKIINKIPTAGLWVGQTDESELGITYGLLDLILLGFERGLQPKEIVTKLNIDLSQVERIKSMVKKSKHKRAIPHIAKI